MTLSRQRLYTKLTVLAIALSMFIPFLPTQAAATSLKFELNGSLDKSIITVNIPAGIASACRIGATPVDQPLSMTLGRRPVETKGFINTNDAVGFTAAIKRDVIYYTNTDGKCAGPNGETAQVALYINDTDSSKNLAFYNESFSSSGIKKVAVTGLEVLGGGGVSAKQDWPYIKGIASLENGKPFYSPRWQFRLIEDSGKMGPTFYSRSGWPSGDPRTLLGADTQIREIDNVTTKTEALEGKFRSLDKNGEPLADGRYQITLNVEAGFALEEIRIARDFSARGVTNDAVKLAAETAALGTCAMIPGCPAVAGLWASAEAIKTFVKENFTEGKPYFVGEGEVVIKDGQLSSDPVEITVKYVMISPMAKALASAIGTLGSWVQVSLTWTMGMVRDLLESTADFVVGTTDCQGSACGMIGPWTAMRNIGLSLLVMALILIAFANVLQVDIEQYGLNRMIPKIIISIFLAFTSWIIVVFFFDFTKAIQDQAIALLDTGGGGGYGGLSFLQSLSISTPSAGNILANSGSFILLLCILIGTLVCGVVLLFTLVMRIVMLSFLLAVAPLAFILNIVPFTSKLYKQWWSEFFKWMFMGPMALAIIALGAAIAASAVGSGGGFGDSITIDTAVASGDSGSRLLIGLIIFAASMYMGATYPLQQGGNIMKGFTKGGKKLAGWAGSQSGVSGAFKGMTSAMADKRQRGMESRANTLLNTASLGKYGIDKDVYRKNQKAALLDAESKRFGFEKKEEFTNAYNSAHGETAKQAILLAGMRKGMIDDGALGSEIAKQAESDETGLLMTAAMKENRESLILHGNQTTAQKASEDVIKKYSSAKPNEIGAISTRLADATKPAISASGLGKYSGSITQQNIDKLKETQGSAYSESLSKMLYDVHGAPQKAFDENTARDAAVINTAHTEAEAENARRDAATASASAAASAQRQAQLNQAATRADSDARGKATVQDEAQRTNDNL